MQRVRAKTRLVFRLGLVSAAVACSAPGQATSAAIEHAEPRVVVVEQPAMRELAPPTIPPAPVVDSRTLTLQFAGDYLLHQRLIRVAQAHASSHGHEGFDFLVERIAPSLAKANYNFINLETPLGPRLRDPQSDPPLLWGPEIAAHSLRTVGFQGVALANNHAFDQGIDGLANTMRSAESATLMHFGGGANRAEAHQAKILDIQGYKVGVFSFTEVLNGSLPRDPHRTTIARYDAGFDLPAIAALRAEVDAMVVLFHWGVEYDAHISPYQRRVARELCDAGVDVVAGTHAHVLQEVAVLEGAQNRPCVVAYGLGNFVSNQGLLHRAGRHVEVAAGARPRAEGIGETRDGALLRVTFERQNNLAQVQLPPVVVPLFTHNDWIETGDANSPNPEVFVATLYDLGDDDAMAVQRRTYAEREAVIRSHLGNVVQFQNE